MMKVPGARVYGVFGNPLSVARRILLGNILGPAIEAQCRYKIGGSCKCQNKEFGYIHPMRSE